MAMLQYSPHTTDKFLTCSGGELRLYQRENHNYFGVNHQVSKQVDSIFQPKVKCMTWAALDRDYPILVATGLATGQVLLTAFSDDPAVVVKTFKPK